MGEPAGPAPATTVTPVRLARTADVRRPASYGSPTAAGATFAGKVYADTSMRVIPGAEITLPALSKTTTSDAKGAFRLPDVPPGTHVVRARAVGYVPFEALVEFKRGQLVERGAESVEVAARVGKLAQRLLWRHVGGGADHHALLGEACAIEREGETEVAELCRAVCGEPDVAGLEVAMDHPAAMGMLERARDLESDRRRLVGRQATVGPPTT